MTQKKKIAILGGGMASMTSAYALSEQPGWQDRYEITVYQMGWRLGGKGASGRNMAQGGRIEEHGLHVWGGFYHNAFALMRRCYDELGRPADSPVRRWQDAFSPRSLVVWQEEVGPGEWEQWPVDFPATSDLPGEGGEYPSIWSYVERLLGWVVEAMRDFPLTYLKEESRAPKSGNLGLLPAWMRELVMDSARVTRKVFDGSAFWLLREAWEVSKSLVSGEDGLAADMYKIVELVDRFLTWLDEQARAEIWEDTSARRAYILITLGIVIVKGIIIDHVMIDNFFVLDDYDLREWLERHGAGPEVLQSAPVNAFYDYFFAYEEGDTARPRLSAGVALSHLLKLVGAYKGAIFWELNAGMGDIVFAPIYEVLKRRGVRFEFFHMVQDLKLASDYLDVEEIRIARQVVIEGGEYEPLVEVEGIPCWPSEPLWDQIRDGGAKRVAGFDYEDRFSDWEPEEELTLRRGVDFDVAVLGISIGEFPYICKELIANRHGWEAMVDQIAVIQTIALQLWFTEDRLALGWRHPSALSTAYAEPLQSWDDRSQVLLREAWPAHNSPKNVSYYCGPLRTTAPPGVKDPSYGVNETTRARELALEWASQHLGRLFPNAMQAGDPNELDWEKLVDLAGRHGVARFDAQYWRANYTPTERYVLSLPHTTRFRMTADTSGYANLVLAGDWLYTGLGGCIEGAVMTGLQACRALTGSPRRIAWEMKVIPWQRERSVLPLPDPEP